MSKRREGDAMRKPWMMPFIYYAVARGNVVGLFDSWYTCWFAVCGYPGRPLYKGFYDRLDAERWLDRELGRGERGISKRP